MKNTTRNLLFCLLMISFAASARNNQQNQSNTNQQTGLAPAQNNLLNITPFFTEDFSGGLPAGWSSIDNIGNGVMWHVTNTHVYNGTDSLSVSGTTAANGYMIYNSDSMQGTGHANNEDNADLITKPIDCTGHANVHLNFNEFLRFYSDTATVSVSVDGQNWTEVHNTSAPLLQFEATPNPNNVDIDISSIAANEDSVWIKFSYKAYFSFYWMIDDIKLHEVAANDGAVTGIITPQTSCTLLSATENVSVTVQNDGGGNINGGFTVSYMIDGGTAVTENVTDTIATGTSITYSFTQTADLSGAGTHTIVAYVTVPGDTNTANDSSVTVIFNGPHVIDGANSFQTSFESSDDLSGFSVEDGNQDSVTFVLDNTFPHTGANCMRIVAPTADDWIFTNCFDLDSNVLYNLTYYSRKISSSSQANIIVATGTTQISGGMGQIIGAQRLETSILYHQSSHSFTVPAAGSYYIGFEIFTADSVVGIVIDDINLQIDNGVMISEPGIQPVSIYPNPTSGLLYVNSDQTSRNGFVLEILNPIGEVVATEKVDQLNNHSIDLSKFSSGIYLVRVISENGISSRQVSVSH